MVDRDMVEAFAEKLRQEPYHLIGNDCVIKSWRLKRECQKRGIPARVVVCLGLSRAHLFGRWRTVPVFHGWAEVAGKRVETSRPLGSAGIWGIVPANIKPVITLRL